LTADSTLALVLLTQQNFDLVGSLFYELCFWQ
jgi:hypothetical protein